MSDDIIWNVVPRGSTTKQTERPNWAKGELLDESHALGTQLEQRCFTTPRS